MKTKYYRALVEDIKAKKGFAKLLETLFNAGLLDNVLKPRLFDLCSVTNGRTMEISLIHLTRN